MLLKIDCESAKNNIDACKQSIADLAITIETLVKGSYVTGVKEIYVSGIDATRVNSTATNTCLILDELLEKLEDCSSQIESFIASIDTIEKG